MVIHRPKDHLAARGKGESKMQAQVLFVFGMALLGFVTPEFPAAMGQGKVSVPLAQNLVTAIAFACIAFYIVAQ